MTSSISTPPIPSTVESLTVPTRPRRAALGVAGVVACALPLVFTLNITRMLLTGVLPDHRYHQLTGQGEILFALWLVPLVLLLRAGWRGARPAPAAGLQHLALIGSGVVTAAVAPGGGAPFLVAVIGTTGALLWAALPRRPRLRLQVRVDPLLAPVALLSCALLVPYAIDQLGLQHAATGHHAMNPHYFDQAWIAVTLAVMALLAATLPAARGLARWVAGALVVIGMAGLALGEGTATHLGFVALGAIAGAAAAVVRRQQRRN